MTENRDLQREHPTFGEDVARVAIAIQMTTMTLHTPTELHHSFIRILKCLKLSDEAASVTHAEIQEHIDAAREDEREVIARMLEAKAKAGDQTSQTCNVSSVLRSFAAKVRLRGAP